ncbi:Uu.00g107470.m01.CDS01 [Anthostomella pinea]|uniref:Uu.00g107470.m01.CDS01 n=1 Tax=Anthostomella pinea TaxID=933095 RepID=A0AAI8VFB1_9PEZI|nr:Uu.00g107470.m01.CDS01 [Anthostomella pinea]
MSVDGDHHLPGPPETQEEWTRVRRKGRRGLGAGRPQTQTQTEQSPATTATPMPSAPCLSVSEIERDRQRLAGQWKSSICCRQLQELVASHGAESSISQAICFGLGSFNPADGAWEARRRAHLQLAAFLSIVEQMRTGHQQSIRCFFQEPLFNSADREFLESLGHQVVESPEGFGLVDSSTMVFGIHLYRVVYSQALAKHTPAIFVGTPYDVWEDFHGSSDLNWSRMKELDQLCDKARFPEYHDDTIFSSTSIHWRKGDTT